MYVEILKPEQYKQWNDFVNISPQGDVFCYTWWLEAITKNNFKICVIKENEEIVAGMPLAYDSDNRINIPPLTRTLGVLYRNNGSVSIHKQVSKERKWLSALLENFSLKEFVQMCMHHNFTDWLPFRWKGLSQTTRYTYIIDYKHKTVPELWSQLDTSKQKAIKRAGKNGIKIEISDDLNLVYRFVLMTYERQGLNFWIPYNDFKYLDDTIKNQGNRLIMKAVDNEKVHSVRYIAYNKRSAYNLISGSDASLRDLGGNTLGIWEAVKYFIDKTEYFNFGGSDIERIENYIRGFGGTLTPYFHIYNDRLLAERNSLKYHITEILFHCRSIAGKIINKFRMTSG